MTALEARDLYRFYHAGEAETLALRGVSLRLEPGEMIAVTGPSGSGKSTLLACLAGLDEPDGGHVELMGRRLSRRPEAVRSEMRAEHIGILLQSGNLFEYLTAEDNVRLQMQLAGKRDEAWLDELLDTVGLEARRHARPSQLSGGEAARAGLAVALAAHPDVLLADEPTGEVDADTEERIIDLLGRYCQQGGAALLVTHSQHLATRAERVLAIEDGRFRHDHAPA